MNDPVEVIGGGLAGCECAYQLAERGVPVRLWEMRPRRTTPAHKTGDLAELVCSNSLRSDDPHHAAGLLKREMEALGSLIIAAARASAVPAGSALAVDRHRFASRITETLTSHPLIQIERREKTELPTGDAVIATGPLTSPDMSRALTELLGSEHLYFYDSIAPIVDSESLDESKLFAASRYDKGEGDDYLNAPFDREQYLAFHRAIVEAEVSPLHDFEQTLFFEGCLPIEELARRGVDTLRFGPMKPVGLRTPDGSRPHAVVQFRREDLARSQYNLVGFQSRMKWGEQKRVFRMIPGLENARFTRLGQVHRNTFLNSPIHLNRFYRLKTRPRIRIAGQITGVEGYLESAATGLAAGLYLSLERAGVSASALPVATALGALARHLTESNPARFQPANINYGLFPELGPELGPELDPEFKRRSKRHQRRQALAERARDALLAWCRDHRVEVVQPQPAKDGKVLTCAS
ncbi:MAG: methylenetetrahydrofolate--tRNA-(uracil(54)-C(5))-methyltransferase (FADH(2)-oxidizing) TrmFO [Acidobacteria bacterium]|nr:methylenetetrahydrofolate--tRNA-(uracil(54)-C(5))-methyltransferase (FADH(2)-oxidizing) TrmFO [Acidobacteriota bacterium]